MTFEKGDRVRFTDTLINAADGSAGATGVVIGPALIGAPEWVQIQMDDIEVARKVNHDPEDDGIVIAALHEIESYPGSDERRAQEGDDG